MGVLPQGTACSICVHIVTRAPRRGLVRAAARLAVAALTHRPRSHCSTKPKQVVAHLGYRGPPSVPKSGTTSKLQPGWANQAKVYEPPPWGGRHIVQGLGVCSYLRAVGFDPHTFSLTDGMRPLRCGGIPSLPSTFRLAITSRLHGGMEANAGGNGGSHVPADPRVPFAIYVSPTTCAHWQ